MSRGMSAEESNAGSVIPDVDPPAASVYDPPPPYPSQERRSRTTRHSRRHRLPAPLSPQPPSDLDRAAGYVSPQLLVSTHSFPRTEDATEQTPLLGDSLLGSIQRASGRQRTNSQSSTIVSSNSFAPSLAQTVLSLLHSDPDDESDVDTYEALGDDRDNPCAHNGPQRRRQNAGTSIESHSGSSHRWPLFSRRCWSRYFRPMTRRAYHAAAFHLLALNFPYALLAWVYLFVFTLTGTTLLITLPLGALLCFLDLLGARAFARGELALQTTFHGPLAYPPPYPPRPIFQRVRPPLSSDVESGSPYHESSFYKNTYAMFTDWTSYQALFYFLVIKPSITLFLTIFLLVVVPVSYVLVVPAPMVLRIVRKLGIWQANVAVEGLYLAVS
ncbi:hypothetical protein DEU56DRAFT_807191 [Suillus clintonianus]|uniref:uncharacterized protein n=1 Tax=Suillus clintonianus TaxID=1904413 RepID=UPI001B87BC41|nr:uncharacterized protein DEU56DRAFT_807191 [Suillus clintonianus]KAG2135470.1 hypothetical protein DEU56DRAFT_807191 [Suillus clintonianus]